VRSITSELDMLSRTGKVDFCQLNKQQLSRSVQSLKQKKTVTQKDAHNRFITQVHLRSMTDFVSQYATIQ